LAGQQVDNYCDILNTVEISMYSTQGHFSTIYYPPVRPDIQLNDRLRSVKSNLLRAPTNRTNKYFIFVYVVISVSINISINEATGT